MTAHQHQFLDPEVVRRRLEAARCSHYAFAELADISRALVSLFLAGRRGLSLAAQNNCFRVLEFFEHFRNQHPNLPIDFDNTEVIKPLFQEFLLARAEAEVIRTEAELKARAAGDLTEN